MNQKMTLREWLPLLGMTLSAFIFNTSEFMPIGLLSDIAASFHMTEAQAGMMITAYSWTVTLLSLPLMLIVCKIDSKKLLLGTIALFGIGQIGSVFAVNFAMLMIARINRSSGCIKRTSYKSIEYDHHRDINCDGYRNAAWTRDRIIDRMENDIFMCWDHCIFGMCLFDRCFS